MRRFVIILITPLIFGVGCQAAEDEVRQRAKEELDRQKQKVEKRVDKEIDERSTQIRKRVEEEVTRRSKGQ